MSSKKVLLVSTSHSKMGDTDKKTGLWMEELEAPYYIFKHRGVEPVIASVKGGRPPIDPKSQEQAARTEETDRFLHDKHAMKLFDNSLPLSSIDAGDYAAVFFAGGHGTVWDFTEPEVVKLAETFYNTGKIVAAVCHGPVALIKAKDSSDQPIVSGKKLTAFSDAEEEDVELVKVVPFSLQGELEKAGAEYSKTRNWGPHAVRDGNLITGQNPASATRVAELVCDAMGI